MSIPELITKIKNAADPQESYETAGRRHNREVFTVEMDGSDWHKLISFLRDAVQNSKNYDDTKTCVIFAESIYQQIRRQGF
ncbi:MAG: hypothetical protein KGJ13_13160 [Patescibacteria group bacterium]|nr:hypothetical protein [Patescibacteria group bacterium]